MKRTGDGTKVRLTKEAVRERHYVIGASNPVIGSKYECDGVIVHYFKTKENAPDSVEVIWNNGSSNVYMLTDLKIMKEEYKSIWK